MVEVSVALAEALLLEVEGAALLKQHQKRRRAAASTAQTPPLTTAKTSTPGEQGGGDQDNAHATTTAAAEAAEAEMVNRCWNDQRAAENQSRVALLSKSLESSDIHDLQILRRSLQRQVDEAAREEERHPRHRGGGRSSPARPAPGQLASEREGGGEIPSGDDDKRWRADVLGQRLDAVERAVETKGGWRSAVFRDKNGSEVDVDVDVEPWPAADAVLMLQTVKDALNVQLMEVWCETGICLACLLVAIVFPLFSCNKRTNLLSSFRRRRDLAIIPHSAGKMPPSPAPMVFACLRPCFNLQFSLGYSRLCCAVL